jgi:polysaccharide chain length determinant protein (PEP-CTERM system associated)
MDTAFIKDILLALKAELIRFRFWCVLLFIAMSGLVLLVGVMWPKNYATSALLFADETNILEPLLRGRAEVTTIDRSVQAREIIYTRGIMETVARERGFITKDTPPEQQDRTIRAIRGGLDVRSEQNNYFRISFVSGDPDNSFETLNTIINVFIENSANRKRQESLNAFNFIDAQVQTYKRQLELAEEKLKEFNSQNVDGTEASVAGRIAELRNEIEALKITTEETEARINTIRQQLGNESQYQQTKGEIDELRQRRQTMQAQLEQLLLVYQEGYPDVISLRAQIADLDNAIFAMQQSGGDVYTGGRNEQVENPLYEELRRQLSVADVDLRGQKRRMQSLVHLLEQEHERAQRVAANQAQLSELTRDYNVTRDVYEEMLQRKESARLSMTLDIEGQGISYRIQEPATFPLTPSGLRFIHFAIIGPILGLLAPIGLLILYVMVDPHFRSARSLQQQLPPGVELIGVIPHYHTPLGERLLRKDVILLLIFCILAMAAYGSFASYWHITRS